VSERAFALVVSPSAVARLDRARGHVASLAGTGDLLIVGASRGAADELAAEVARARGGLFGVSRAGFHELLSRLALPALAAGHRSPTGALGAEAVAARAAFEARADGSLRYFGPVADLPGFPRAASRTLSDLQMSGIASEALAALDAGGRDLADLQSRIDRETARAGTVTRAGLLRAAADTLRRHPERLGATHLLLLDVAVTTQAETQALVALVGAARTVLATVPEGDASTIAAYAALTVSREGGARTRRRSAAVATGTPARPTTRRSTKTVASGPDAGVAPLTPHDSLSRLQRYLFADEVPAAADSDDSVVIFSAPGEGREAVEIARRVIAEARRGVRFDEMAVLLRAPQTYLGVLEHALDRAGIPAWFSRGTRRPDPAGRALLALLACADEDLSARRFAEYVSLGQVPSADSAGAIAGDRWASPVDEVAESAVPVGDRLDDESPDEERRQAAARGETAQDVAGTLRAPWRWETLIVEAAVMGGIDRWRRRLAGLAHEYARRLAESESDDPESSRARGMRRDVRQLEALRSFAEPVLAEMAEWPDAQNWGPWLTALNGLAERVLTRPGRVLRVLQELAPLETVGPVRLREVREVLTPRLSTLTHEPPRRRHGRLFVGTPHSARGRAFRVVFVPGLAERLFPQRIREDALLPDAQRTTLAGALATQPTRASDERLHLRLAVGAAAERAYLSFPRIEGEASRPRVPSFYVLDAVRAVEGAIPMASSIVTRAQREGAATLAWPAPPDPSRAIDDFEHDLSTLAGLLKAQDPATVKGRARYLYELSPELRRSLTARWLRWHRRGWDPADGLVRVVPDTTGPGLATQRLGARPYSLTALQRFAACPYQFLLSAIYRLAPLEQPAPLQQIDPLTRGDLFHRIQARALRSFQSHALLPLAPAHLPTAQKMLEWAVTAVEQEAYDLLAPAIDRVWRDEIASMTRDLKIWLEHLAVEGAEWTPERFEFAFGLDDTSERDEASTRDTARVAQRFQLRGSIDVIERHRQTRFLRVTDHKTGRNRTERNSIVQGGRVLQPVVYGLALESLWPHETVYSGRLSFCTSAGGFAQHEIPLMTEARRVGLEALEIIDRSIERGLLAARPDRGACKHCDFLAACGHDEERRTRYKDPSRFADLDALRHLP